jgi:chromosome partitioning protein
MYKLFNFFIRRFNVGKIISIFNNKGGIGKTTSALSLSHGLAKEGIKTLIIDIDPQGNASEPLVGTDPQNSILDILNKEKTIDECITQMKFCKDLYCLPNNEKLVSLEPQLVSMGAEGFGYLRDLIADYCRENFEVTIIDCPPSFGIFVISALFCSDLAIVPTEAGSKNSIKGLFTAEKWKS